MQIERYKSLISEDTMTMRNTDLHKFVYEAAGKFEELKAFRRKIVDTLGEVGAKLAPTLREKG